IRALTFERPVEMYITESKTREGVLTDHFERGDANWGVFHGAFDQIHTGCWRKPEIMAVKYGGIGGIFAQYDEYPALKEHTLILCEMIAVTI
ncbi:MAG TPA: hypothetical protein PK524_06725, partial [Brevefilum fermentans]|nr:hypothetical protein [Brevefilum fermentans]